MNRLKKFLQSSDIRCYVAAHDQDYGRSLYDKLSEAIDSSDAMIVILTHNGSLSASVNQEIGYAKSAGKRIIPLIESGVTVPILLQGTEYVTFSSDKLEEACKKVSGFINTKLSKNGFESVVNDDAIDVSVVIDNYEPLIYEFNLLEDETIIGQIISDKPVNVFIVNNRNLRLYENDQEFSYEDCIERTKRYKINFQPPRSGIWNVVIENEESDDVDVDVYLDVK